MPAPCFFGFRQPRLDFLVTIASGWTVFRDKTVNNRRPPTGLVSIKMRTALHCQQANPNLPNTVSYFTKIIENDGRVERTWDVFSRLMKDRILFIGTPINHDVANNVIAQLLFLQMEDPKKDIHIYINSPGGSVTDGMAIYDTMCMIKPDVVTYCVGIAASMSTVLLAAGTPGKRFALPNSRVMIHQPSGGATGQTSDISIAAKEIIRWKQTLNEVLADHTGQPIEKIEKDSDRDFYMTAQEARDYGIVDEVFETKKPAAVAEKKSA